jgi:outer membrane protein OmpA-like peptidoglycan-associated protein
MKKITKTCLVTFALGAFTIGCSHAVPRELTDARTAYERAARSPNAALVPGDVADAKSALSQAEREFNKEGDEPSTRALAYVAQRRAISAKAKGEAAKAINDKQMALAELDQLKQRHAVASASELERAKTALSMTQQQAESERRARIAADEKAQALLSKVQDLKSERTERGLVLTLPGGVLFASGKSVLLPSAQDRLRQVAMALKNDNRTVLVVGHTDNTGKEDMNQRLSENRADAVRKFLIQNGVPENRLRTSGMGESQPIESNKTPAGRAMNRRVEMILEDSQVTPVQPAQPQSPMIQQQGQPMQQQGQPMQQQGQPMQQQGQPMQQQQRQPMQPQQQPR